MINRYVTLSECLDNLRVENGRVVGPQEKKRTKNYLFHLIIFSNKTIAMCFNNKY